jgi:hypothetical protein
LGLPSIDFMVVEVLLLLRSAQSAVGVQHAA